MSIKDKVAIVASSCTPFGEHWDRGTDDLLKQAAYEALEQTGREAGRVLARHRTVRDERHHARASARTRRQTHHARRELLRVRLGSAAQCGVRRRVRRIRRRDGHRCREGEGLGLPGTQCVPDPARRDAAHADRRGDVQPRDPGVCANRYGVAGRRDARRARAHRLEEPRERRPQPARAVPSRDDARSRSARPRRSRALGVLDCAGVADGAAAAIVVRAEDATRVHRQAAVHQGAVVRRRQRRLDSSIRPTTTRTSPRSRRCAADAYAQAGIDRSADSVRDGRGARLLHADRARADGGPRVLRRAGRRTRRSCPARSTCDGDLPVNPDGGLKSFGHPVGATGLRMLFECWLQLRGEAPADRQIDDRPNARAHAEPRRAIRARWCRSSRSSAPQARYDRRASSARPRVGSAIRSAIVVARTATAHVHRPLPSQRSGARRAP